MGRGAGPAVYLPAVTRSDIVMQDDLLLWQVVGRSDIEFDGRLRTVRTGQALWVPGGTRHSCAIHESAALLPMAFTEAGGLVPFREPTVLMVDTDLRALLFGYIQGVTSIMQREVNIERQILRRLAHQQVLPSTLAMPRVGPAREVAAALRADPADSRPVEELAASVHASVRTIERAFLSQTGLTLQEWRRCNRMEAAADLLRGHIDADAVARRVGYLSVSAFRRVFKSHHGMTPVEFARRFAEAS